MDSLITAAARALAAGDPLGALKRVALRDDAPALALRGIAMAQLGDLVRAKALLRSARARLRSERGRGPCAMRRRRGRDRARLARPELAGEGARRGAGDARSAWRPGECRACAVSRGPAPASDRPSRRGRAQARRSSIPRRLPPAWQRRPRTGRCRHRDAAAADEDGARGARPGRDSAARDAGIPALMAEVESAARVLDDAGGAADRARRGASAPARGGRSAAGLEGARRRCLPPCRA